MLLLYFLGGRKPEGGGRGVCVFYAMFTFDSLDNLDFFLAARSFQMGPKAEQPPLAWFFGCFMVYSCPPTRCLSFVFSGSPGILAENLTEFLNACLL